MLGFKMKNNRRIENEARIERIKDELYRNPACHHMSHDQIRGIANDISSGKNESFIYLMGMDNVRI